MLNEQFFTLYFELELQVKCPKCVTPSGYRIYCKASLKRRENVNMQGYTYIEY